MNDTSFGRYSQDLFLKCNKTRINQKAKKTENSTHVLHKERRYPTHLFLSHNLIEYNTST